MSFRTPAADHLDTRLSRTKIPRITGQLLDRTRCCPNIGTNDVGAQIDGFILASGAVGAEMMRKLFCQLLDTGAATWGMEKHVVGY